MRELTPDGLGYTCKLLSAGYSVIMSEKYKDTLSSFNWGVCLSRSIHLLL